MRAVFALVLVIGMALAGAAVYMIQNHIALTENLLAKERAFNAKAGKLVEVYVFAAELQYGDALKEEDVQLIYWPEATLPESIFRDKALLFPENAPGPRYIMRATEAYEPVLASRVTEPGELAGLTAKLAPGMRAFGIKVGVASGVAGFVKPDDFIDIYWTGNIRGSDGESTRLIESSIQIIAVDKAFNEGQTSGSNDAKSVTVAATPEQVARLAQAQSSGKLTMSLVGDTAAEVTEKIEIDTNELLGIEEIAPVIEEVVPEAKVCTRKERKGTEVIETVIPCTN
jgi:pilus assembly protein CpaB